VLTHTDFQPAPIPNEDITRLLSLLFGEAEPTSDEEVAA
jgi:hypothetical protein